MRLSIIIVNYKTKDLLKDCLDSIKEDFKYEIIVIDNNSQDGSAEYINKFQIPNSKLQTNSKLQIQNPKQDSSPEIRLITNKENLGFAKAVNQGLKIAQGEYILLLNPDTKIKQRDLSKCLGFLEKNSQIGILGCQLVNSDNSLQGSFGNFPSLMTEFFQATFLCKFFPFGRWIPFGFLSKRLFNKFHFVDWVGGGFMLFRKEVLDKIGGLDEKFFMYFEDVDFCKRAKQAGWKIIYWPEVKILHHHMQSAKKDLALAWWQEAESLIYYFKKYQKNLFLLKLLLYLRVYIQIFIVSFFFILLRIFKLKALSLSGNKKELLLSYKKFLEKLRKVN